MKRGEKVCGAKKAMNENEKLDQDKEQIKNKSIFLIVCQVINGFITILSSMVIPRCLPLEEYALYKQSLLVYNTLFPFLALGLSQGLYFFLPLKEERKRNLIVYTYIIYVLVGTVYIFFLILGGGRFISEYLGSSSLKIILYCQIPYIIFSLINQCVGIVYNIENKIKNYILYSICRNIVTSIILVLVVILQSKAISAVVVLSICELIFCIIGNRMVMKILPKSKLSLSIEELKSLLFFSLPIGISGMIGIVSVQIDQIFISVLYNEKVYAVYSVGATDFPYYSMVISSISTAMLPLLRKYIVNKEYNQAMQIEKEIAGRVTSFMIPLMFFLMFWAREYISFMYSARYINSAVIFRIYLMQYPLYVFLETPIFVSMGLNRQLLKKTMISCLLNIFMNILCIWRFGFYGAAIGTVISGYIMCFLYTMPLISKKMGRKKLGLYPYKEVLKAMLLALLAGVGSLCIKYMFPKNTYNFGENIGLLVSGGFLYLGIYVIYSKTCMKDEYTWVYDLIRSGKKKLDFYLRRSRNEKKRIE